MRTLNLQLVGSTPLLLHHVSKHQLRTEIASKGGALTVEEEASEVMVRNEDGNPAVPVSWIWDALRFGCSRIAVQGKQISFSRLQSLVQLPKGLLSLKDTDNKIPTWETEVSMQHAALNSKKRIVVVAPKFRDWMLVLPIQISPIILINDALENNVVIERVFAEAGRGGIGLFHPPKKQFGKFTVAVL